jgi:hypothetical protein
MPFKKGETPKGAKPFKKGQTGNPEGRPKKLPALDKLLADVLGTVDDQDSEMKAVINALIGRAKKGDVRAAEVLLDRAYGKPKQDINLTETIEQVFVIGGKAIKF